MASAVPTMWGRTLGWVRRNMPTRDSMENNRLLRPVAHRVLAPELWRFTRRSVPRGVALGVVAGFLFPVAQIAIAAVFALPFRANVPVAALTTFITNPLTTPIIWVIAYRIGTFLLRSEAPLNTQPVAEAATGVERLSLAVGTGSGFWPRAVRADRRVRGDRLCRLGIGLACVDRAQMAQPAEKCGLLIALLPFGVTF